LTCNYKVIVKFNYIRYVINSNYNYIFIHQLQITLNYLKKSNQLQPITITNYNYPNPGFNMPLLHGFNEFVYIA